MQDKPELLRKIRGPGTKNLFDFLAQMKAAINLV